MTKGLGSWLISMTALGVVLACGGRDAPSAVAASRINAARMAESDRGCSVGDLEGAYGFYLTGATSAGPLAAVGLATYDGQGNWVVTQTTSRNGTFTRDVASAGTYELGANCAGKLFSDGQEIARIALIDGGHELDILSETPGEAVRGVSRKVGLTQCSVTSLAGMTGFYRFGTTPAGPLAAVGVASYDGAGNETGVQTISRNGVFVRDQPIVGQYEIDEDCTGRLLANGQPFARTVLVDKGTGTFGLSLNPGNSVNEVEKAVGGGQDGDPEDH